MNSSSSDFRLRAADMQRYTVFQGFLEKVKNSSSDLSFGTARVSSHDLLSVSSEELSSKSLVTARITKDLLRCEGAHYNNVMRDIRKALRIPQNLLLCPADERKPTLVIPFVPSQETREFARKMFDDYSISYRHLGVSSNELFDTMMHAMMQHARNFTYSQWRSCVEIAGELDVLRLKAKEGSNSQIHCCYDMKDIQHLQIYSKVVRRMSKKDYRIDSGVVSSLASDRAKFDLDTSTCMTPMHCTFKAETVIFNHLLVDYSLTDVAEVVNRHGATTAVGVVMFTPEMIRKDSGVFPSLHATFEVDRKRDVLTIRFLHDRMKSRTFTYSKYMSLVTCTVAPLNNGGLYLERMESSRGCFFMYKAQLISDVSMASLSVPKHRVWFNISEKVYLLRMMKPKYFGVDTSKICNYEWVEMFVDKKFYDGVYLHALDMDSGKFKLSAIREYVIGKASRHIVNIKDVTVAYDYSIETQENLSLFVFMNAYIERHNISKVVSELLRRTNTRRVLGRSGVKTLIMKLMWEKLYQSYHDKMEALFSNGETSKMFDSLFDPLNLRGLVTYFSKLSSDIVKENSIQFEKMDPELFVEYEQLVEKMSLGLLESVRQWVVPYTDIFFKGSSIRKPKDKGNSSVREVVEFSSRADLKSHKSLAGALDMILTKAKAKKEGRAVGSHDIFDDRGESVQVCDMCYKAYNKEIQVCFDIPCGCICGASGHKKVSEMQMRSCVEDESTVALGVDVSELPDDLKATVGICFDDDEIVEMDELDTLDDLSDEVDMKGPKEEEEVKISKVRSSELSLQSEDSGVDIRSCDEDIVVVDESDTSTASSSIHEDFKIEYVCDPLRVFPSALVAKRRLGLTKMPVMIRSVDKKGKSRSIQREARMHLVSSKKIKYSDEDFIYFAIPRDLKVVCYSFERREMLEEVRRIYEKVSSLREYTDVTSSFRSLERAYDSTRVEELSVELAPISCPIQVLQQEYDQLFPGISTVSYHHDHHWANQGDIDVDITVPRMEIDFTKWYLPPKILGSVSKLRTAQGGLNPQTPLALMGSAMQRNFEVEYQATAQSIRRSVADAVAKALSLIGVRYPDGKNFLHILDEYQKEPLTIINEDAFMEYISKQTPEAIERIATEDLGDEFIKYHMHCLMNKDTTKPKLDGSIATTTPVVQTIVYNQQFMNATVSPQFEILTRRLMDLLRPEVQMFIGKSIPELERFINDNVYFGSEFPTWGDADGSKFDKSQQEFALLCELYLYKLLGWQGFDFDKWFEAVDHKSMLSYRAKLRLQLAFQRSSGNRNTALGNSIVMLLAVFSRINIEYDQLICAINLGDDITFAIHGPIDLDGFDDAVGGIFNISVKCMVSSQGYILGHYILQKGDRVKLMYDIYRKLESLGRMDKMNEEKLYDTFISFKDNVKTLDDELWLPLLQKAVEVRNPHLANSNVRLIARAMKTLSVDFEAYKELYEELSEHY